MAQKKNLSLKRLWSSDTNVYLIGKCEPKIVGVKLPSKQQVLQCFFYNVRCENKTVNESSRLVLDEVLPFWEKARIPTPDQRTSAAKVIKLYQEWRTVQKVSKSQFPSHRKKENDFQKNLNNLFDIAHVDALKLISIQEDRDFLIKQRENGRIGSMTCFDPNVTNKEKRRAQRLEDEKRRKERYEKKTSTSDYTQSLRLVEVRIPNYVVKGSSAQLECLYDLDGESLYSVKWYKDGNEFYRYVPRDMPPAQTFLLPGVAVELHNSSDAIVTLRNVNLQSAGRFRCEVSGEAPSFQTVTEHGDMVVVSLPDQGPPKITGGRPRYQIGDWVRINCTVGRSKPAVQLSWFVNGEPAEPRFLRKYDTIISGREGLETSVLGLQFRVDQHHFRNGDMKLKCVASLSTLYWRSNEESVEGDRPLKAPVLESRETVYASNSRADPVQASKTDSLQMAHAPNLMLLLIVAAVIASGCLEQLHMWQQWLYDNFKQDKQQKENAYEQHQQQENNLQQHRQSQQHHLQQQHEKTERQLMRWQLEKFFVVSVASESSNVASSGYQSVMPFIQWQQQQQQRQQPHQQQRHSCVRRQHWHINENNDSVERKCKRVYEWKFVNLCTEMLPALTASFLATYATIVAAADDDIYCFYSVVNEGDVVAAVATASPIKRLLVVR